MSPNPKPGAISEVGDAGCVVKKRRPHRLSAEKEQSWKRHRNEQRENSVHKSATTNDKRIYGSDNVTRLYDLAAAGRGKTHGSTSALPMGQNQKSLNNKPTWSSWPDKSTAQPHTQRDAGTHRRFCFPYNPQTYEMSRTKFPVAQNDILCYAFRSAVYVAMSSPQSVAAWRFVYGGVMPKWFACLGESIGISIITLAVLLALISFFTEKCS